MANYNRSRGSSYYPNYGNREEDRGRYNRRDYNQYDNDFGDIEDYGRRDFSNANNNRRWRRYDEDYDDYRRRGNYTGYGSTGNYGYGGEYNRNRAYDEDFNEDYGAGSYGYGVSYNRNRDYYGNRNRSTRDGDRDWWDKTRDEVSSWFGDEDAERRRRMDKRLGQHRGRGPKGYARSDERIREDVNDRLSDDSFLDASEIEVQVNDGDVILTGTVDTRIDKRRAEDLAEDVSGVKNVQNQLRVKQTTATAVNGLKNQYQG